jgi:hypothetical protein
VSRASPSALGCHRRARAHTAHDARLLHNPVDACTLRQELECPSFVALRADGYRLRELHDGFAS